MSTEKSTPYSFIDLFAGAGGLSEGFIQAGFLPVAHVEMNSFAAKTLETRSAYYYLVSEGKGNTYYDYLRGSITREKMLEAVPEECLNAVICETMSDQTMPFIFKKIDSIHNTFAELIDNIRNNSSTR